MKKNKNQDKSLQDNEAQNKQKELEARIDDMLQVSPEERRALRGETIIKVSDAEPKTDSSESAFDGPPALPKIEKKNTKIAIKHDDDQDESVADKKENSESNQSELDDTAKDIKPKPSVKPLNIVVDHQDDEPEVKEDEVTNEQDSNKKSPKDNPDSNGEVLATDSKASKKTKSKTKKNTDEPAKTIEAGAGAGAEDDKEQSDNKANNVADESDPKEELEQAKSGAPEVEKEKKTKKTKKKKPKKVDEPTEEVGVVEETEEPEKSNKESDSKTTEEPEPSPSDSPADEQEDTDESDGDKEDEDDELAKAIAAANEQLAKRREKSAKSSLEKEEVAEKVTPQKGKILDIKPAADDAIAQDEELAEDSAENEELIVDNKKPVTLQPDVKPGMVNIIAQHMPAQPTSTEKVLEDGTTDKVVEQIIANEGDTLLEVDDEIKAGAFTPPQKKRRIWPIFKIFTSKKFWLALLILLFIGLALVFAFPRTRYTLLNTFGVRSSLSLKVVDQKSLQPLRGVKVSIAGTEHETDKSGQVSFENLKLGDTDLVIKKRAFAQVYKEIIVGWGSNPLGEQQLTPTGSQYTFIANDFLSGKPIANAEASSGEYSAQSDAEGKIILTIDEPELKTLDVQITAEGQRTEEVLLNLDDQSERQITMVASRKQLFVSKRTGTYDLYAIDADGQNEVKILPGTGSERDDLTIVHHPVNEYAAFVSTRDNKRNDDGFLLSTLTAIDITSKTNRTVVSSERIQIVGWVENKLVYVRGSEGSSASNPQRNRLISYDVESGDATELAAGNYFNDVMLADDKIYYALSGTYAAQDQVGLFRINADGSSKQRIYNKEVWKIFRLNYDALTLAVEQNWVEYKLDGQSMPGSISEPASKLTRAYNTNPSGIMQLWVDNRDGKGVLLALNNENNEEKILQTASGLRSPVRWLNDTTFVYRVVTGAETADYVMSTQGGEARKITDVTNTNNPDSWYYY